jgi:hypothetical protein
MPKLPHLGFVKGWPSSPAVGRTQNMHVTIVAGHVVARKALAHLARNAARMRFSLAVRMLGLDIGGS